MAKILRAVPERSRNELEEIAGESFVKMGEGIVSDFQKKKASGMMATDFPTIDGDRATADSVGLPYLDKLPVGSWRVPVSLPGLDVLVPQESKLSMGW